MRILAAITAMLLATAAHAAAAASITLAERMAGAPIGAQVEILEDPGGLLTVGEVRVGPESARFRASTSDSINLGFRDAALWVRISLARGSAPGPWVLEVGYPLLDRVELYAPGSAAPSIAGDQALMSQRDIPGRTLLLPLDPAPGTSTYLLRVRQAGSMNVPLKLWDAHSLQEARRAEAFLLGAYYGLLVVMVLYNLVIFLIIRDPAYAAYGLYVSTMGVLIAINNGYGSTFLWPEAPTLAAWAQAASPPLTCATAAFFTRLYLHTPDHTRLLDRALRAIGIAGAALGVFSYALPSGASFFANHSLAAVSIVAVYLAGLVSWRRGYRPATFYLIAFFCVAAGALLLVARNLGLPASALTDYGMQWGSALEIVLLSMGLADRITILRQEKLTAQAEALASQQKMVDGLRESERLLEQRVAERTESLQGLNRSLQAEVAERERAEAALKASEERMRFQAQHDPLTGLPNRWLLRDRLEQAAARAKRERTSFAVLLVDLDNFKAVNDTLGHDVGDLLLVEVAQRLESCTREPDTIARLGGDEFVLVLEGLTSPVDAARVADKVVDVLAAPFHIAGARLETSPSIGVSVYPRDAQDADFLLKFADVAMYQSKAAGRNRHTFYADLPPRG